MFVAAPVPELRREYLHLPGVRIKEALGFSSALESFYLRESLT
jgi:hypothetical protein